MALGELDRALTNLASLVNDKSQPNFNELWRIAKDIELVKLNLKFYGYELATRLAEALPPRTGLDPMRVGLRSKPSTQADLSSDWVAYWASELKIPVFFHRKLWELTYVLQAIYENDLLSTGKRGLGFGCGTEPIASYLASHGVDVTVTDLPPAESAGLGWQESNQHTASRDAAFHEHLVSRELFDRHVSLEYVDMNNIPDELSGYDFNWSICAFEHLGSIAHGMAFIENSMKTIRPGGLAVHTTEFNFLDDNSTIDNWATVLFQRKHFTAMAERLRAQGHQVAELDFDVGDGPLDKFIDLPPFVDAWPTTTASHHIKLSCDGFACTCFGLLIRKGP